jgi:hypothetical protein
VVRARCGIMTAILSIAFQTVKPNTSEATVSGVFPREADLRSVLGHLDEGIFEFQRQLRSDTRWTNSPVTGLISVQAR